MGALGLYVHWPFCRAICPYCDFNVARARDVDRARWRRALLAAIDDAAARTPGRRVASLFFGGGTPSLMPAPTVAAVIDRVADRFGFEDEPEITLEANPNSAEARAFAALRTVGVTRLSLGVQALDDAALKWLGRDHTAAEARRALATAQALFPRVGFDLIYGRPGQTAAAWRAELGQAVDLALSAHHRGRHGVRSRPGARPARDARDRRHRGPLRNRPRGVRRGRPARL